MAVQMNYRDLGILNNQEFFSITEQVDIDML